LFWFKVTNEHREFRNYLYTLKYSRQLQKNAFFSEMQKGAML